MGCRKYWSRIVAQWGRVDSSGAHDSPAHGCVSRAVCSRVHMPGPWNDRHREISLALSCGVRGSVLSCSIGVPSRRALDDAGNHKRRAPTNWSAASAGLDAVPRTACRAVGPTPSSAVERPLGAGGCVAFPSNSRPGGALRLVAVDGSALSCRPHDGRRHTARRPGAPRAAAARPAEAAPSPGLRPCMVAAKRAGGMTDGVHRGASVLVAESTVRAVAARRNKGAADLRSPISPSVWSGGRARRARHVWVMARSVRTMQGPGIGPAAVRRLAGARVGPCTSCGPHTGLGRRRVSRSSPDTWPGGSLVGGRWRFTNRTDDGPGWRLRGPEGSHRRAGRADVVGGAIRIVCCLPRTPADTARPCA